MTDKEKRIQRAKDMIKYYDAQKKAALKGKNKELAKKMLKNDLEEITIKKVDGEKGFDYKGQFITDPTTDPSGRFDVDPKKYYKLTDKQLKDLKEADLSKKQIKMVHKVADDLPKKDFKDRYGKEKGDAVRFGTATNMVKKKE